MLNARHGAPGTAHRMCGVLRSSSCRHRFFSFFHGEDVYLGQRSPSVRIFLFLLFPVFFFQCEVSVAMDGVQQRSGAGWRITFQRAYAARLWCLYRTNDLCQKETGTVRIDEFICWLSA